MYVQVLESLYEMGPEAAERLLPLIAAESDMATANEHQHQHQQPRLSSQDGGGSMRMRSRPVEWNGHARSYSRAASGGRAGILRVRQVYGGGFGKTHSARSNQEVMQY